MTVNIPENWLYFAAGFAAALLVRFVIDCARDEIP